MAPEQQDQGFEERRRRREERRAARRAPAVTAPPVEEVQEEAPTEESLAEFAVRASEELKAEREVLKPQEPKPPTGEKTFWGWFPEFGRGVKRLVTGLAEGLVQTVGLAVETPRSGDVLMGETRQQSEARARRDARVSLRGGGGEGTGIGEVLSFLWKGMTAHWRRGGIGNTLYYNSPEVILDLTMVASLTGGSVSRTGGILKSSGRLAVARGAERQGVALWRAGKALERVGAKIARAPLRAIAAPIEVGGKQVARIPRVRRWLDDHGIGSESKWIIGRKAHEIVSESNFAAEQRIRFALRDLPAGEQNAIMRALFENDLARGDVAALSQAARGRYVMYRDMVRREAEPLFEQYRALTPRQKLNRRALGAAWWRATEQGKSWARAAKENRPLTKAELREWRADVVKARAHIQSGIIDPVYAPFVADPIDLYQWLGRESGISQRVGRLERAAGLGSYSTDPAVVIQRSLDTFHAFRWKMRWFDRVKHGLMERGLIKAVQHDWEVPKGWAILSEPFFQKYWGDHARAATVLGQEIVKSGKFGQSAQRMAEGMLRSPEVGARLGEAFQLAVPRHVAVLLAQELHIPGKVAQFYDRMSDAWRFLATIGNPRYYMTTVVGNVILATLYGVNPAIAARLWRLRKVTLPPELISRNNFDVPRITTRPTSILGRILHWRPIEKVATTLRAFISATDNLGRRMIWTTELEAMRRQMGRTGAAFFAYGGNAEEFHKAVSLASRELSDIEVQIQRTAELATVKIPQYHRMAKELANVNERLAGMEAALVKDITGTSVLRADEAALARRLAELEAEQTRLLAMSAGRAEAVAEAAKLRAAVPPGTMARAEKQVAKLMRAEHESAVALDREILKDIRARGGIAPAGGLKEELRTRLPRGLWARKGKGIAGDELAQEMFDRGLLGDATQDALFDRLARMVENVKAPKLDPKLLGQQARLLLQQRSTDAIRAILANLKAQAGLRPQLRAHFRRVGREVAAQLRGVIGARTKATAALQERYRELQNVAAQLENELKTLKADVLAGSALEDQLRLRLPDLARKSAIADRAIVEANAFFGEYNRLHPLERSWFRRAVPFYPFMKTMVKLVFSFPLLRPKRAFAWHHFSDMMLELTQDKELPGYMRHLIPVAVGEGDSVWFMSTRGINPFGGVRFGQVGEVPVLGTFDPTEANPFLKATIEVKTGMVTWLKRPMSPGERMVRMDNGEMYEWTGRGTVRKTMAVPRLDRALYNLFPQSQLLEQMWHGAKQTDRGWIFGPDPIRLTPDSAPAYPKEWWERMLPALGVPPLRKINRQELKERERMHLLRIMREFYKEARKTRDPKRRDDLIQVLREYYATERAFIEAD